MVHSDRLHEVTSCSVDTSWLVLEALTMVNKSVRYTPEFKRQMLDLVRAGRTPRNRQRCGR